MVNTVAATDTTALHTAAAASDAPARYEVTLDGPFSLARANDTFGGWPAFAPDPAAVAITFPVEGWRRGASVLVRQEAPDRISGAVYGAGADAAQAWQQALATLSLDSPAQGWLAVGTRDPVIGRLQQAYQYLRPVLFHSPYEAAAAFIIGHRISIAQGRAIRLAMAQALGTAVAVDGTTQYAFPVPQALRTLDQFPGLSAEKVRRLQGVAEAALDGWLERAALRALPVVDALAQLQTLTGIGAFFAQGILLRGAGLVDEVTDDPVSKEAVQRAYGLPALPDQAAVLQIAEAWRPYRMWATVLLHVWLRREGGGYPRPGGEAAARSLKAQAEGAYGAPYAPSAVKYCYVIRHFGRIDRALRKP